MLVVQIFESTKGCILKSNSSSLTHFLFMVATQASFSFELLLTCIFRHFYRNHSQLIG